MLQYTSPAFLFPSIQWWMNIVPHENILIDADEKFQKMSERNRYCIATANGKLQLAIPIEGGRDAKTLMKNVAIDYKQNWQKQHWGAIFSAYGRAPFFEQYSDELHRLIFSNEQSLLQYNLNALNWVKKKIRLGTNFLPVENIANASPLSMDKAYTHYHQVFEAKNGFIENLSILDLLMNEGPIALQYLKAKQLSNKT